MLYTSSRRLLQSITWLVKWVQFLAHLLHHARPGGGLLWTAFHTVASWFGGQSEDNIFFSRLNSDMRCRSFPSCVVEMTEKLNLSIAQSTYLQREEVSFLYYLIFFFFFESPCCSPGWFQTHNLPASVFQVLKVTVWAKLRDLVCLKKKKCRMSFNKRCIIAWFQLPQLFSFSYSDTVHVPGQPELIEALCLIYHF